MAVEIPDEQGTGHSTGQSFKNRAVFMNSACWLGWWCPRCRLVPAIEIGCLDLDNTALVVEPHRPDARSRWLIRHRGVRGQGRQCVAPMTAFGPSGVLGCLCGGCRGAEFRLNLIPGHSRHDQPERLVGRCSTTCQSDEEGHADYAGSGS